jgi:hypothetical protein
MTVCVQVRSIGRSVWEQMAEQPVDGRVHSVFRRTCYLYLDNDSLLALVAPELDNGPLNIVLARVPAGWLDLQPGMPARVGDNRVPIGGLAVCLDGAATWEPCPDWERLRAGARALLARLQHLATWSKDHAPGDSMLALVHGPTQAGVCTASAAHARALLGAEAMWAGWRGDEAQLRAAAAQLAGLGGGLTPAGDDFVLGVMLSAWLAHPDPGRYCKMALEASAGRTTMLSAAFLRAAAGGECGAAWHRLLESLGGGSDEGVTAAAAAVLSHGHSSGADALAGFLWMGLRVLEG